MLEDLGKPLTVQDVAKALGVPEKWVYRHRRDLGGIKLGHHVRFFEKRLSKVLDALHENSQKQSTMAGQDKGDGLGTYSVDDLDMSYQDSNVGKKGKKKIYKTKTSPR